MRLSSRSRAVLACAYRAFLSTILSLLLVPGPDGLLQVAGAAVAPAPLSARGLALPPLDARPAPALAENELASRGPADRTAEPASMPAIPAGQIPVTQVQLTASTAPNSGQAGTSYVYVSGSNFPAGTILSSAVNVYFSGSCGATPVASVKPGIIQTVFGSTRRLQVLLPATLASATYYVSLAGATTGGSAFTSANCSTVQVTSGVGPAAKLVFSAQPTNGTAGTPLNAVSVQIQDATGKLVSTSTASVTITSTPSGVGGTTTVAAVNGVATFSNLVFTNSGSYTLTAGSTGLTSARAVRSTSRRAQGRNWSSRRSPRMGRRRPLALASVVVKVEDAGGNVVTGPSASITISSTPSGVGGTTTMAAVNGVATFSNLVFTATGCTH